MFVFEQLLQVDLQLSEMDPSLLNWLQKTDAKGPASPSPFPSQAAPLPQPPSFASSPQSTHPSPSPQQSQAEPAHASRLPNAPQPSSPSFNNSVSFNTSRSPNGHADSPVNLTCNSHSPTTTHGGTLENATSRGGNEPSSRTQPSAPVVDMGGASNADVSDGSNVVVRVARPFARRQPACQPCIGAGCHLIFHCQRGY